MVCIRTHARASSPLNQCALGCAQAVLPHARGAGDGQSLFKAVHISLSGISAKCDAAATHVSMVPNVNGTYQSHWIQCTACFKWRRHPLPFPAIAEEDPWYCWQHPGGIQCEDAEEQMEGDEEQVKGPNDSLVSASFDRDHLQSKTRKRNRAETSGGWSEDLRALRRLVKEQAKYLELMRTTMCNTQHLQVGMVGVTGCGGAPLTLAACPSLPLALPAKPRKQRPRKPKQSKSRAEMMEAAIAKNQSQLASIRAMKTALSDTETTASLGAREETKVDMEDATNDDWLGRREWDGLEDACSDDARQTDASADAEDALISEDFLFGEDDGSAGF